MTKLDYYWASRDEWIHWDGKKFVLNDDAPEAARNSYNHYINQMKEREQNTIK